MRWNTYGSFQISHFIKHPLNTSHQGCSPYVWYASANN